MEKTLIAIPCLDSMSTTFVSSLINMVGSGLYDNIGVAFEVQSLVYESRGRLAAKAVNEGYQRILFLDSDMCFQPDLLKRLSDDMDEGRRFVSAVYYMRKLPTKPVLCKSLDWYIDDSGWAQTIEEGFDDIPDGIFEIAACGFGAVLMDTKLLTDVLLAYKTPPFTPMSGLSEDYAFCWRLGHGLGVKMWADSRIPVKHCGLWLYGQHDWDRQRKKGE